MEVVVKKIQNVLDRRPLFFVVPEAERAIGLEELFSNYHIISNKSDYISQELNCKVIEDAINSARIIDSEEFIDYVKESSDSKSILVQFFKNTSDSIGKELRSAGFNFNVLNNTAKLTRQIENKINQYKLLAENGFLEFLPESEITNVESLSLGKISDKYKEGFVLQFPFGHTGSSTEIFQDFEFEFAKKRLTKLKNDIPKRICKISRALEGEAFTINACNYKDETYVAGLSYQFTGIDYLTGLKSATVGNDWGLASKLLDKEARMKITALTEKIGQLLKNVYNFKGLFGLDLIINDGKIYIIEINPRQTASVSYHTKLQLDAGQLPLSLINLAEFLDVDIKVPENYNENQLDLPLGASQIFLRSMRSEKLTLPETDFQSGEFTTEDGLGYKLVVKPKGYEVDFNEEIARIQSESSVAEINGAEVNVRSDIKNILQKIRQAYD